MTDSCFPAEDPEDVPEPRDDDVEDRLLETDTPFEEPPYLVVAGESDQGSTAGL